LAKSIQSIRGMNDILPESTPYWQWLEDLCRTTAHRYGYREIRFPILEQAALFKRTIGEDTDIVFKEMYTFEDRNGDHLSLRPEGTAGCVRAGIQNGLLHNQIQRLSYFGPMFRHERPQKGRYRQFHQFGIEAFGMTGPDIDAEVIVFGKRLWEAMGLQDQVRLEINSLGTLEGRARYRELLVAYFTEHQDQLDEDSRRRLTTNPLRILDSKNPKMQSLILAAPTLMEHLDDASKKHFDGLCRLLDSMDIAYRVNPHLVRGLDYYGLTVFEWVSDALGAQATVCAGGRYDILVEQLGGKSTPATGFALGLERLVLLLEKTRSCEYIPDVYLILVGDVAAEKGMGLAEQLRDALPTLCVETNCSGGSFKSQFKRADKSGARYALIVGDDELISGKFSIKNLREKTEQQQMSMEDLIAFLGA